MRFRAHDTFFIRKGWLSKGMKNVYLDSTVFMGNNDRNPMDILGIGANMVKALRYWLQAVGLTEEPSKGRKEQTFTSLGDIIFDNDRYIEETGTLWLLHYKLATNSKDATAWYYFFNEFTLNEFSRDDFIVQIGNFLWINNEEISERSLEDDYNCIVNTYVPRIKSNPGNVHPENNIDCPLGELGLIDIVDKKNKIYKKSHPEISSLHPLIVLAIIIDQAEGFREIKISAIQNDKGHVGKIFNLDIISITNLLYKIELLGYIKVERTAGLDVIQLLSSMSFEDCVREYYRLINNQQDVI